MFFILTLSNNVEKSSIFGGILNLDIQVGYDPFSKHGSGSDILFLSYPQPWLSQGGRKRW